MFLTYLVLVVTEFMQLELILHQNKSLYVWTFRPFKLLILSSPHSSVSFCWFESLTSPPPPALCSDAPLCCCGWLPPVCGIYSDLLTPAQPRSSSVRFLQCPIENQLFLSFRTFFKAHTSSLRASQLLEDSSAEALCFSICIFWMLTVFCSLAPSSSSSLILALSLSSKSSCDSRQWVMWYRNTDVTWPVRQMTRVL